MEDQLIHLKCLGRGTYPWIHLSADCVHEAQMFAISAGFRGASGGEMFAQPWFYLIAGSSVMAPL